MRSARSSSRATRADYERRIGAFIERRELQQFQRLLYVAATRAKRTLVWIDDETLYAGQRRSGLASSGELLEFTPQGTQPRRVGGAAGGARAPRGSRRAARDRAGACVRAAGPRARCGRTGSRNRHHLSPPRHAARTGRTAARRSQAGTRHRAGGGGRHGGQPSDSLRHVVARAGAGRAVGRTARGMAAALHRRAGAHRRSQSARRASGGCSSTRRWPRGWSSRDGWSRSNGRSSATARRVRASRA